MNNIVKDIKHEVEKTLRSTLTAVEKTDSLEGLNSALFDAKNMCVGIDKLYEDDVIDATLDATKGEWGDLVEKLDDC